MGHHDPWTGSQICVRNLSKVHPCWGDVVLSGGENRISEAQLAIDFGSPTDFVILGSYRCVPSMVVSCIFLRLQVCQDGEFWQQNCKLDCQGTFGSTGILEQAHAPCAIVNTRNIQKNMQRAVDKTFPWKELESHQSTKCCGG